MDMDDAELTPDQLYMAQIAYVTAAMQADKKAKLRFDDFVLKNVHEPQQEMTPEQKAQASKAHWGAFLMQAWSNKKAQKGKEDKNGE